MSADGGTRGRRGATRTGHLVARYGVVVVVGALLAAAVIIGVPAKPAHTSGPSTPEVTLRNGPGSPALSTGPGGHSGTSRSWSTPPSAVRDPAKAPPGFRGELATLYSSLYTAALATPGASPSVRAMTPARFRQKLSHLSSLEVDYIYSSARSHAGFARASASIDRFVPVERRLVAHLYVRRPSGSSQAHIASPRDPSGLTLTTIPDSMPQSGSAGDNAGSPIADFVPTCPQGWQTNADPYADNAIFGLQIVIDALSGAYNILSQFEVVFPGTAVVIILLAVAQGIQNWGVLLKSQYNDCMAGNMLAAAQTIDNSTFQTYQLLASVAATANEADTNLASLINQNVADYELQLQGVIEQALVTPTTSAPMGSMELPATSGGYLDSTPVGVQQVVTTEVHNLAQLGQLANPAAIRYLGLASQAYAASNFKLSFQYYRLAYQAAAG